MDAALPCVLPPLARNRRDVANVLMSMLRSSLSYREYDSVTARTTAPVSAVVEAEEELNNQQ